jgi:hypothetical protein
MGWLIKNKKKGKSYWEENLLVKKILFLKILVAILW